MSNEKINPKEMYDSLQYGFSHAVKSGGDTLVHCSGQVAWDKDANMVGEGDLAAQARQAMANLTQALAAAGATPSDVVRLRIYVVDHSADKLEAIMPALTEFYGGALPAANTLIGVQALALPEFLIEVEATAQID